MSPVPHGTRRLRHAAAACVGAALLLGGCASQPSGGPTGPAASPSAIPGGTALPDDGLVLQVDHTGGLVTPRTNLGRLPLVSVYADGRVITEGPVAALHPGPALPNLQVAEIAPDRVEELVGQALDAGVGQDVDHGMPPVADAPHTRFTVVTAAGTETTEVYALEHELPLAGGEVPGLSVDQVAARAPLLDLLEELTAAGDRGTAPYVPEAVAAVAGTDHAPGASPDDVATWPGPPLPGDPLGAGLDLSCVVARGETAGAALEAAADATTETAWQNPDGGRWALTVRPLLPHESGCADLPTA